jgi:hypothetical protein
VEANDDHGHGSRPHRETPAKRLIAKPITQVYICHCSGAMQPLMSPTDSRTTGSLKDIPDSRGDGRTLELGVMEEGMWEKC